MLLMEIEDIFKIIYHGLVKAILISNKIEDHGPL